MRLIFNKKTKFSIPPPPHAPLKQSLIHFWKVERKGVNSSPLSISLCGWVCGGVGGRERERARERERETERETETDRDTHTHRNREREYREKWERDWMNEYTLFYKVVEKTEGMVVFLHLALYHEGTLLKIQWSPVIYWVHVHLYKPC